MLDSEQAGTRERGMLTIYLRRAALIWSSCFIIIPFFLFVLFIKPQRDDIPYFFTIFLFVVFAAVLLSAKHGFVLKLISFKKHIDKFLVLYAKRCAIGIIVCFILTAIAYLIFSGFFYNDDVISFKLEKLIDLVVARAALIVSIISLVVFLFKYKPKGVAVEAEAISLEQIYYICIGRIIIPFLLIIWSTFLFIFNAIPRTDFFCFAFIGVYFLYNAKPKLEHFTIKCRSCGKDVLYGASSKGYCLPCAEAIKILLPKARLKKHPNVVKRIPTQSFSMEQERKKLFQKIVSNIDGGVFKRYYNKVKDKKRVRYDSIKSLLNEKNDKREE